MELLSSISSFSSLCSCGGLAIVWCLDLPYQRFGIDAERHVSKAKQHLRDSVLAATRVPVRNDLKFVRPQCPNRASPLVMAFAACGGTLIDIGEVLGLVL
jgi:hypothetical protein